VGDLTKIELLNEEKISIATHYEGLKRRFLFSVNGKQIYVNVYEGLLLEKEKRLHEKPEHSLSTVGVLRLSLSRVVLSYSYQFPTIRFFSAHVKTPDNRYYHILSCQHITLLELYDLVRFLENRKDLA
jgi:hypothetical protein